MFMPSFNYMLKSTSRKLCRQIRCISRSMQYTLSDSDMNSLISRVNEMNTGRNMKSYLNMLPFEVRGDLIGYIHPTVLKEMMKFPTLFHITQDKVVLSTDLSDIDIISSKIADFTMILRNKDIVNGWRDELLPVVSSFYSKPLFLIERAALPLFGLKGYGVHVNGYTRDIHGDISHMWVGKRSKTKSAWPSMYDHIVAGGQPYGISPYDNVMKECSEEANIPEALARTAKSAGAVSYDDKQLKRDVLFLL